MKQLLFVGMLTLTGVLGPFVYSPFCGVAVYYVFAVLRPQYMWEWSLPKDVQWSRFVSLATIAAAVAAWLGLISPGGVTDRCSKRPTWTNTWMACFFFWLILSYLMARNREAADLTFTEYQKIFIMYGVSSLLIRTVRQVWILMNMTAIVIAYICYEINYLYFIQGYLGIERNGYGGLDNNGAGLMLAMGIPLCVMVWDGMKSRWRWAFLAMVPVIVHAVLMTYSRGAMVSMIAVCPILAWRCRHRLQLAPFGVLLAAALPFMAGAEIQARFFSLEQHEVDESANSRRASWAAAWAIAKENPIFGVGIRNSPLLSHQYGADMEGRVIHSQYLQIGADNGFVGLGFYLAVLASTFHNAHRVRRAVAGRDDLEASRVRAVANGAECSLATFCVGATFLSLESFELPYLVVLLGAQAASLAEPVGSRGGGPPQRHDPPVSLAERFPANFQGIA